MPLAPAFYAFRPWSHTDRRQMLMLTSEATASVEDLGVAEAQALRLFEITPTFAEESYAVDIPAREALLNRSTRLPENFPYFTASWSPRAPSKLRIHSTRFVLRVDAYGWTDFMQDQNEERGRLFFVAQLMDPANAQISP